MPTSSCDIIETAISHFPTHLFQRYSSGSAISTIHVWCSTKQRFQMSIVNRVQLSWNIIPDNDLEQNLNKGIWALWENLEGCKASWQEENFEQKFPEDRAWPAESDRAAIKEKRGTRSMSLKPLHLNYIENKIAGHGQWPSIKYRGLFIGLQSPKWLHFKLEN